MLENILQEFSVELQSVEASAYSGLEIDAIEDLHIEIKNKQRVVSQLHALQNTFLSYRKFHANTRISRVLHL